MTSTLLHRTFPVCLSLVASASLALAAPTNYSYDDSTAVGGPFAGSGIFSIDIGAPLGEYLSTDAAGSGDSFGVWNSVVFRATAGTFPSIVISNLIDASISFSFPGIGGGEISSGSQADLEWEQFLTRMNADGFKITALPGVVPEASTWLSGIGLALAGVLVLRRTRTSGS